MAGPERIVVCGCDERAVMYGLYNLEQRMNLREAPFLPVALDTTPHSLYRARMILSGLGYMEWPDAYLRLLAHYGPTAARRWRRANLSASPLIARCCSPSNCSG